MASLDELKERIDCHELALKLGLQRPGGGSGNYRSPKHDDKSPSLSVFEGGKRWKDHSSGEGGTCIDLVMYVTGVDVADAVKQLHELYSIPMDLPARDSEPREISRAEYIANKCFENPAPAAEYLAGRGIHKDVIEHAIKKKAVGFNDWCSDVKQPGEVGYGGPAAAFIVRTLNPGHVAAVDLRYLNPDLNGGLKTQTQGEKSGVPWVMDPARFKQAKDIYLVESPINALSIESCHKPNAAAVAIRGARSVAGSMDYRFLQGKRVIICMDADKPDEKGSIAGAEAAWICHERLTALNIACHIVDQKKWYESEWNDINDILQAVGADELSGTLTMLEPWVIPGLWGRDQPGRGRVWLPSHDYAQYWKFRAKEDFTSYVKKVEAGDDGQDSLQMDDLCSFRIAGISRVTIASANATMSGEQDSAPELKFAVTVQTARHGNQLVRRVVDDEKLHNVETWQKFGSIYARPQFLRMINILERATHIGERNAVNFVGIAWRQGQPIVNEGPDCYFMDPKKQCPYWNLMFPSGTREDARKVLRAYASTMKSNAAAILLTWALGGHLKAWLGFWPHMILQADKGAGKSTLIKAMERSIAFTMFSGQSLQTEYRLLTSVSHTSHPVGWEELSARRMDVIDKAVSLLQESYNFAPTRRGSEMTEYLVSAPVLLAGEDVPVKSLLGKVVRSNITGKKGERIQEGLPRFPVLEWLQFLVGLSRDQVHTLYKRAQKHCQANSMAVQADDGGKRMVDNYAALLTVWRLLEEFCGEPKDSMGVVSDILAEMNSHISETSAERQPWVWIMETILGEISNGNYRFPFKFIQLQGLDKDSACLLLRTTHVMQHLSGNMNLRDKYNALPVKSDRILKRQLMNAGVVACERIDATIGTNRECHMVALSLKKLNEFGLYVSQPEDTDMPVMLLPSAAEAV
jgi:hypothetical protein